MVKPGYENTYGVAEEVYAWACEQEGWRGNGWMDSPILGGDGNKEFLLGAHKAT